MVSPNLGLAASPLPVWVPLRPRQDVWWRKTLHFGSGCCVIHHSCSTHPKSWSQPSSLGRGEIHSCGKPNRSPHRSCTLPRPHFADIIIIFPISPVNSPVGHKTLRFVEAVIFGFKEGLNCNGVGGGTMIAISPNPDPTSHYSYWYSSYDEEVSKGGYQYTPPPPLIPVLVPPVQVPGLGIMSHDLRQSAGAAI